MIAHGSANLTMEAFHTLRCRKFSIVQVIGRSGSNQIIGGRRVHCDDDDDDDDDHQVHVINDDDDEVIDDTMMISACNKWRDQVFMDTILQV
jgi:hypothetical protein